MESQKGLSGMEDLTENWWMSAQSKTKDSIFIFNAMERSQLSFPIMYIRPNRLTFYSWDIIQSNSIHLFMYCDDGTKRILSPITKKTYLFAKASIEVSLLLHVYNHPKTQLFLLHFTIRNWRKKCFLIDFCVQ